MSVERVVLTAADERYAPPEHEIDIAYVLDAEEGGLVYISCYAGSEEDLLEGRKSLHEVPVLRFDDLMSALAALGAPVASLVGISV